MTKRDWTKARHARLAREYIEIAQTGTRADIKRWWREIGHELELPVIDPNEYKDWVKQREAADRFRDFRHEFVNLLNVLRRYRQDLEGDALLAIIFSEYQKLLKDFLNGPQVFDPDGFPELQDAISFFKLHRLRRTSNGEVTETWGTSVQS